MTEIQRITSATWAQTPAQLKNFPIIIPDGVEVNKIYACIKSPETSPEGELNDYAGDFFGNITLDLSMAFPSMVFVVLGFHDRDLVAEYQGLATDLERLDQVELMAV